MLNTLSAWIVLRKLGSRKRKGKGKCSAVQLVAHVSSSKEGMLVLSARSIRESKQAQARAESDKLDTCYEPTNQQSFSC